MHTISHSLLKLFSIRHSIYVYKMLKQTQSLFKLVAEPFYVKKRDITLLYMPSINLYLLRMCEVNNLFLKHIATLLAWSDTTEFITSILKLTPPNGHSTCPDSDQVVTDHSHVTNNMSSISNNKAGMSIMTGALRLYNRAIRACLTLG